MQSSLRDAASSALPSCGWHCIAGCSWKFTRCLKFCNAVCAMQPAARCHHVDGIALIKRSRRSESKFTSVGWCCSYWFWFRFTDRVFHLWPKPNTLHLDYLFHLSDFTSLRLFWFAFWTSLHDDGESVNLSTWLDWTSDRDRQTQGVCIHDLHIHIYTELQLLQRLLNISHVDQPKPCLIIW